MVIGTVKVKLYAGWVHSLKEKRMVVKSIVDKIKHRYNVSIAEVEAQDFHQTIIIGMACVSSETKHADSMIQDIINYIEKNTEAVIEDFIIEIL